MQVRARELRFILLVKLSILLSRKIVNPIHCVSTGAARRYVHSRIESDHDDDATHFTVCNSGQADADRLVGKDDMQKRFRSSAANS